MWLRYFLQNGQRITDNNNSNDDNEGSENKSYCRGGRSFCLRGCSSIRFWMRVLSLIEFNVHSAVMAAVYEDEMSKRIKY